MTWLTDDQLRIEGQLDRAREEVAKIKAELATERAKREMDDRLLAEMRTEVNKTFEAWDADRAKLATERARAEEAEGRSRWLEGEVQARLDAFARAESAEKRLAEVEKERDALKRAAGYLDEKAKKVFEALSAHHASPKSGDDL